MTIEMLLQRILSEPVPDDLWALHPHLLAADAPEAEPARDLARQFYCYLTCVRSKLTSRQYSSLAAALAASSVSVIGLQNVIEAVLADRGRAISNLLASGLASALETFSTFQHVKAWETEFASVHQEAVWHLYAALWQISAETQPGLPAAQRQALIDRLLVALRDARVDGAARLAAVIRLYQILLAIRLAPLIARERAAGGAAPGP